MLTPSLQPHRGGSPGIYSVHACSGFASAWRHLQQPGRQVSPKDRQGPQETAHAVHSLVLYLRVQAHRRSQQVWIFHCYFLPVPQCAASCSLLTCRLRSRKGQEPHKQGEKRSGAVRPPGLLIPPDIRALMNVLSWSREYCRKLSPPASLAFAGPQSYQGYLTFPGERSNSCRSAAPGSIPPPRQAWGAWPARHRLPRAPFGCCCSPHSHPTLPKVSLVSFYFRFFWVGIILILFCLHNPDCYHPTITHTFSFRQQMGEIKLQQVYVISAYQITVIIWRMT